MFFTKFYEIFKIDNKYFLYNIINESLIEIDYLILNKIYDFIYFKKNNFTEIELNILKENEFLIPKKDIYKFSNDYIRYLYNKNKYTDTKNVKIDIALTNNCNFKCIYCYEKKILNKYVNINISNSKFINSIINYIKRIPDLKNLELVWFGGEPMYDINEFLFFFTEINNKFNKDITIINEIITNGYNLNEHLLFELKKYNINYFQVTLDGIKNVHNRRRIHKKDYNSFEKIIKNIKLLLDHEFNVIIRINIDKNNSNKISEFLYFIYDNFKLYLNKNKLTVSLNRVFNFNKEFDLYEFSLYKLNLIKNFPYKNIFIENQNYNLFIPFCDAESDNKNLTIDRNLNLYKCWNYVFDQSKSYGILNENGETIINSEFNKIYYIVFNNIENFNVFCFDCKYYPFCKGICPDLRKYYLTKPEIVRKELCKYIVKNEILSKVLIAIYKSN